MTLFILGVLCFVVSTFAQSTTPLTEGTDITLRNTLQDPDAPEVTYASLFGQADDAFDEFATLSNTEIEFATALSQSPETGAPFPISGLYEIDLTESSVEFTALPDETDPFWVNVFGLFPEGKVDRYYLTFSEPHNITSAASNHTSVSVRVDSEMTIVVEIGAGYDLKPGVGFFISFNMAEELTNEEKARAFNKGLQTGDVSALNWMRNDYIQHNLTVPTGREPLVAFYNPNFGTQVDILRSFQTGDYVFIQSLITFNGFPNVFYDVWRFEDGMAVEHWDNSVPLTDDMDGTTQIDGALTPATDLDKTTANQALLEDMAQTLFVEGDWTNVRDYFNLDNYIQHSVGAGPDGAFLASLEGQTGVSFYDDIKFIHVSGNFGLVMSQGSDITGQDSEGDYAYYDLFRMENGKIVEHWDAITKIEERATWANNNGKWGDDAIGNTALNDGADITLRNTLQDPGEPEVTYASLFGQADDAFDEFATLSSTEVEFATALAQPSSASGLPFDISGLYSIDLTENSIEFAVLPSADDPFWSNVFGLFPAGKVDRYYLTFSEPHNITSAASNHTSVGVRIDSETTIVVEIMEGYDLQPGVSFFISLNMAEELTNEEKARAFNTGLINGDASVIKWIRNDYIQHNLGVPTGKAPIAGFYGGQPTGITVDVHRSFEIGDFVFAQTTLGGTWGQFFGSGTDNILYEVWRFEDGYAVEHWDNIVAVMDDMDGTTQTDGAVTPATDLLRTDANRALLEEMAQTLFIEGDWTNVRDYFDLDNYIQHSVGAGPDGAFLASLEGQTGLSFYDDIKFIHVSGNFGLVMSQGPDITSQDPDGDYAYYDLFRMENGKIVEHWDAITKIPPRKEWAHNNGKWGDDAIVTSTDVDLNMEASVANQLYEQYKTVDYTFTLTNEGDTEATNIEVEAMLPEGLVYTAHSASNGEFGAFAGIWTVPSLAVGESATLNLTLFALAADQDITYFAQVVAADQVDADSTPDSSSGEVMEDDEAVVTISPKSNGGFGTNMGNNDLELSIAADRNTYNIYEVVGYTLSVSNNGDAPATGIEVSTTLPAGMAYTASSTSDGSYSVYFQTWTIDALGAGETAVLNLDLFTLVQDQPITNFAQIFIANELDPDSTPGNNTTGVPAEDDEAAVTIQFSGSNANLAPSDGAIFSSTAFAANMDVSLAPNPFNGSTNFEIQLAKGGAYQLQVFDVTGKEVNRQRMELNEGVNRIAYDGSHLTNGLYSYLLSNVQGFVSGRMIVVE